VKIYVNTDIEGICGVFCEDQLGPEGRLYPEARRFLTAQVNAAVEGAYEGGATEVIVLDGHAGKRHLLLEEMDERGKYVEGGGGSQWLPFLEGCDGMLLVGVHAKAGTQGAVIDHTQSLWGVRSIVINGIEVGEIGQATMIAGAWNVPLLMAAGDEKACAEANELVPGIAQAVVKWGTHRFGALHMHPRAACRKIKECAKEAMSLVGKIKPYVLKKPVVQRMELATSDIALQTVRLLPRTCQAKLVDSRTVECVADDIRDIGP